MSRRFAGSIALLLAVAEWGQAQARRLPAAPPMGWNVPRGRIVIGIGFRSGWPLGPVVGPGVPFDWDDAAGPPLIEPARFRVPSVDLSGVDLDAGPAPWAKDRERIKREVPPKLPPVEVVKKADRPPEPPPGKTATEPVELKVDPVHEGKRLLSLGLDAFRSQEYGLAARRFQQAIESDPASIRAHFLAGQALFALGQYRDAVQAIGLGLGHDPGWPHSTFRPRFDLYAAHPADWLTHMQSLEDALARQPNNAGYLFLLAHQRWFDDQRNDAAVLFRRVRPLVPDPALVDLFLKK